MYVDGGSGLTVSQILKLQCQSVIEVWPKSKVITKQNTKKIKFRLIITIKGGWVWSYVAELIISSNLGSMKSPLNNSYSP